ncbi:hypothetical protein [Peribacillus butanolivorans]
MVTKTGIQQTLCVSKDINKRFTKALEENEILEKIDGKYRINPAYHFGGMAKERKVIKLFTTTLKLLAEVIKPAELGFLYKLLPYVHFDTNMICTNPHEGQPELIQYLNEKAISELLNKDYKEVKTLLRKLRKAGVLAKTTGKDDERNNFHHLNPYIFYRKSGRPNDTLNGIFAASPYCPKNRGDFCTPFFHLGGTFAPYHN